MRFLAAQLLRLEASPVQVPQCCLCPAASVLIRWHLGLSLGDAVESSSDREKPGCSEQSQRARGVSLSLWWRGENQQLFPTCWVHLRQNFFLVQPCLCITQSPPRTSLLVYLEDPRDAPPDSKAITGCLRLHADFSGEAPNPSTPGSPQGCVAWPASVFHILHSWCTSAEPPQRAGAHRAA